MTEDKSEPEEVCPVCWLKSCACLSTEQISRLRASLSTAEKERDEARNEACVRCGFPTHDITTASELRTRSALEKALGALRAATERVGVLEGHLHAMVDLADWHVNEIEGIAENTRDPADRARAVRIRALFNAADSALPASGGAHVDGPKARQ